jgi:hypothetical protein
MEITYSKARTKFIRTLYVAWGCAGLLLFVENLTFVILLATLFTACAIRLMTICCEKCGTPVYLGNSKIFGLPEIRLFPSKNCPKCGVSR